ncbi:carbohydrate kinase family protein [Streptomyces sp. 1331.2]|uniref:carbohydrate kinase family protein n=1 Tax=Streptomyces sp. 1331.2 TaxID=1938835 RepID=UPI000BD79075|nr:carbohydrate kinase [Streptomyces sp. 1331.2]SOB85934.1 fructokinase [Streptomyces sp. 1331.2]
MTSPVPPVLVIGECVADIVRSDGVPDRVHPGGSPANVAYGLARLGRPAVLLTELGPDANGRLIRSHLESAGVLVRAAEVARTPSAVVRLDGEGRARYTFDIGWTLPPTELAEAPAAIHLGSIGAVTEPGAAAVLALVERWRGRTPVSYDPNVRPALMGERAAAVRRVERCVALSDLVKASDEDLAWLYPGERPEAVAERWLSLGPSVVAVTLGAGGAFARTAEGGRAQAPAVPVPVADTVGAGDSFMAALLHARASGADLPTCLTHAVTAAALTVARPGANPPSAAELAAALTDGREARTGAV